MYSCDKINTNRSKIAVFSLLCSFLSLFLLSFILWISVSFSELGSDPRIRTPNGKILHRKEPCLYTCTSDKKNHVIHMLKIRFLFIVCKKEKSINILTSSSVSSADHVATGIIRPVQGWVRMYSNVWTSISRIMAALFGTVSHVQHMLRALQRDSERWREDWKLWRRTKRNRMRR